MASCAASWWMRETAQKARSQPHSTHIRVAAQCGSSESSSMAAVTRSTSVVLSFTPPALVSAPPVGAVHVFIGRNDGCLNHLCLVLFDGLAGHSRRRAAGVGS